MSTQRRKQPRYSMVVAMAVWLALGLAAPVAMHLYSGISVPDAVEASPSDSMTLFRPVVLAASPLVQVERGTVMAVSPGGKPVSVIELMQRPAPANLKLVLDNATITIGPMQNVARRAMPVRPSESVEAGLEDSLGAVFGPIVEALSSARFESLSLRRSVVVLRPTRDAGEVLTDVKADVVLRRRGSVTVKGSGLLRGQAISFAAQSTLASADRAREQEQGASVRTKLTFELKAPFAEVQFDGHMTAGEELGLEGQGELSAQSGRQLVRWFGTYWPSGPGLRDVGAKGRFKLANRTLTFEKASVRIDGNEGSGVISLRLLSPRPQLTGTLAYKTFDVRPYFEGVSDQPKRPFNWAALTTGSLTVPFGMHLDADLRVSTDRLMFGGFDLGRSAATITLNDGRLLADLAELGFAKGEGRGQIAADFTGFVPKVTIRGKLDKIDLGALSNAIAGSLVLDGPGTVVADLAASGNTIRELMDRLAGKVTVNTSVAGRLGIDLKSLAMSVATGPSVGWRGMARGTTQFDKLDLKLVLREGILLTENAEIAGRDASWIATGVVNLPANSLDLRLVETVPASAAAASSTGATKSAVIEFRGSWTEPVIRDAASPAISGAERP